MSTQPAVSESVSSTAVSSRSGSSLNYFFSAADARLDLWHQLQRMAQGVANAQRGDIAVAERDMAAILTELTAIEELFGYPGPKLMSVLVEQFRTKDYVAFAHGVRKVNNALITNLYRHDPGAWRLEPTGESAISEVLPPSLGTHATNGHEKHRPYFEVLLVSPGDRTSWSAIHEAFRALSRPEDQFVYEPVIVGSLEDAVLAVILNYNIQAVVAYDGFPFNSRHNLPLMRELLARHIDPKQSQSRSEDFGTWLARITNSIRPELDYYLLSDGNVEEVAGADSAAPIKRVFYAVEELLEVHLSVLAGVDDRFRTPYFDNLKHYAQRPIGTFHALPVARGKSIFKSNWIRDMGEFYGATLFLAESSATTGGLDSLLEPTGNIKLAQEAAARCFGGDKTFFVTNGTSTANKIVGNGLLRPGDIVLIDRDCHKSHHYGMVLAGAQPYYIDAYPLTKYSMYGSVPIRKIKEALLNLKAEGKLDKVKMLVLTNSTFDGHLANTVQTMEECLAIKPDLIFLWDEAWSAFARFSPFLRRRTAMGGAEILRQNLKDPQYRRRYEEFTVEAGDIDPKNKKLLDIRLYPDPSKTRVRVYQTTSVHKSMSSLRQGSIIVVSDQDFHEVEEAFREAFFAHTSTSPNLQIIASLDVARRQMELEGYELVTKALALAIELRREVNHHPVISKYFKVLTPEDMIPAEYRKSGLTDYGAPGGDWLKALDALREDEFCLDPTRVTLLCGNAGFDGTQFKALLSNEHDIQLNKTSRNSVLVQININNTRSDIAHLIKALADISRKIDHDLEIGGAEAKNAFKARVKSLIEDVPDLPDFSRFHDAFRDNAKSHTSEGHMREAFYTAYDAESCEHIKLASKDIDTRLEKGPELVSANFVIPYPPGFPIMVPGQVITREIITFMRKLDVKEIHGYTAAQGLKVIKPSALETLKKSHREAPRESQRASAATV